MDIHTETFRTVDKTCTVSNNVELPSPESEP